MQHIIFNKIEKIFKNRKKKMGQKVNPISLRLQQTNREFDNCWYTDYFYRKLVSRDIYLQQYINSFLKLVKYPSARFSIQYTTKKIKLSSFLCYPKQSRELRSRMFGITLKKKRKTKLRKIFGKSSFLFHKNEKLIYNLPSKKTSFRFLKRKKTLKFLIDNRLWSRVYHPFNKMETQLVNTVDPNLKNKNARQLDITSFNKIYNTLVLRTYTNKNMSISKNYINKPVYPLLPFLCIEKTKNQLVKAPPVDFPFQVPIVKQLEQQIQQQKKTRKFNQSIVNNYSILQNKNYTDYKKQIFDFKEHQLLFFIKNFVTSLFFIKLLNILKSKNFGSFLFHKNEKQFLSYTAKKDQLNRNFLNFNIEYRKNFIKFFLVFYLLYTEYNRNTSIFKINKVNFQPNLNSLNLNCSSNNFSNYKKIGAPLTRAPILLDLFTNQTANEIKTKVKYNSATQNILNSIHCFSSFQPISIFHTTLQNNTPINFLLQHFTTIFFTDTGVLEKNTQNLSKKNPSKKSELNNLLHNKQLQTSLFSQAKKDQLQELKYKNYIQCFLGSQFNINTEFLPFAVSQDWQSAGFLADEIVYFLERRVAFRRLKHKIIKKFTENSNIRGVRISCSGRVGGKSKKAQRAKTECVKYGQTSRHTFSSRIDFAVRTARTIFGSVGIKVWICYN